MVLLAVDYGNVEMGQQSLSINYNMQSERKLRRLSLQTRSAREHSCSVIPTREEAKNREEALHNMHKRHYQQRRKSLEEVVRQNIRLYVSINQQKSSYENLFLGARKTSKRRKSSVKKENEGEEGQAGKPDIVMIDLKKVSKWAEMLNCNVKEGKRRYFLQPLLRERCPNFSQNTNYTDSSKLA